jgi:BolA protein
MAEKLEAAFSPSLLQVIDESHHHAGHSGSRPDGESHFRIRISAAAFDGLNRVNQHRKVNEVLAEELNSRVHALAIEVVPASRA